MKLKDRSAGKCRHGLPKKELCEKCWKRRSQVTIKKMEKFLKDLAKAEKLGRKSKLQFD